MRRCIREGSGGSVQFLRIRFRGFDMYQMRRRICQCCRPPLLVVWFWVRGLDLRQMWRPRVVIRPGICNGNRLPTAEADRGRHLVFRASTSLQAAPAAELGVRRAPVSLLLLTRPTTRRSVDMGKLNLSPLQIGLVVFGLIAWVVAGTIYGSAAGPSNFPADWSQAVAGANTRAGLVHDHATFCLRGLTGLVP
jgi:hypothetical protein